MSNSPITNVAGQLRLRINRDYSLLQGHPWIFSGAVKEIRGTVHAGDVVDVTDNTGQFIGRAFFNPESQIAARLVTRDVGQSVDAELIRQRVGDAIGRREDLGIPDQTDAYRCVYFEVDQLPGLIVDRYADFLVLQFLTPGIERFRADIIDELRQRLSPRGIYERSDTDVREREGLPVATGVVWGEEPPQQIEVANRFARLLTDVRAGHKTGLYLDQRVNVWRIAPIAGELEVLNCFAYTGAFGITTALSGAERVINVESSDEAIALGKQIAELNGVAEKVEFRDANVFEELRRCCDSRQQFDMVILDPPKFAFGKSTVQKACRGYKDINLFAMKVLRRGGYLVTFSCSGPVTMELFTQIVHGAAADAGVALQVIDRLHQPADHPALLGFPESEYLKGLVCQVL